MGGSEALWCMEGCCSQCWLLLDHHGEIPAGRLHASLQPPAGRLGLPDGRKPAEKPAHLAQTLPCASAHLLCVHESCVLFLPYAALAPASPVSSPLMPPSAHGAAMHCRRSVPVSQVSYPVYPAQLARLPAPRHRPTAHPTASLPRASPAAPPTTALAVVHFPSAGACVLARLAARV